MAKKPAPNATPKEEQEGPLGAAILPRPKRRILWPVVFLINCGSRALLHLGWGIRQLPNWFWSYRWSIFRRSWAFIRHGINLFFRVATLVSVGYLVYDRIYEADAT